MVLTHWLSVKIQTELFLTVRRFNWTPTISTKRWQFLRTDKLISAKKCVWFSMANSLGHWKPWLKLNRRTHAQIRAISLNSLRRPMFSHQIFIFWQQFEIICLHLNCVQQLLILFNFNFGQTFLRLNNFNGFNRNEL